jgi:hypothetical protein
VGVKVYDTLTSSSPGPGVGVGTSLRFGFCRPKSSGVYARTRKTVLDRRARRRRDRRSLVTRRYKLHFDNVNLTPVEVWPMGSSAPTVAGSNARVLCTATRSFGTDCREVRTFGVSVLVCAIWNLFDTPSGSGLLLLPPVVAQHNTERVATLLSTADEPRSTSTEPGHLLVLASACRRRCCWAVLGSQVRGWSAEQDHRAARPYQIGGGDRKRFVTSWTSGPPNIASAVRIGEL